MPAARVLCSRASLCAILFVVGSSIATAQFRGVLEGTIKDASGAVIPGAKVTLTATETQRQQSTTSSAYGFYHFAGLPPGTYSIEASAKGMSKGVVKDVSLA